MRFSNNFSLSQFKTMQEVPKKVAHGKKNHKMAIKSCQIILKIKLCIQGMVLVRLLMYDSPSYIYKDEAKRPKVKGKTKGFKKFFT